MKVVAKDSLHRFPTGADASFLGIAPDDPDGFRKGSEQLDGRIYWREQLAAVLKKYNQAIGNDGAALANIEKLTNPSSVCVFTGQQPGFMGGPAYTILKAISCLLLARKQDAIPVFWLATEDHDTDEIDHAFLLDPFGNLKKFHLPLPRDGRFAESLELNAGHTQVVASFIEAVAGKGLEEIAQETSYARMSAKVLAHIFRGTGLVIVEPYLLRSFGVSFFRKEIEETDAIQAVLADTTHRLEGQGGKPALALSGGTNLFLKTRGQFRKKIVFDGETFHAGGAAFSRQQLLAELEKHPENFSTNVAARPVLQSLLFPVAAYVAGPGELGYYRQLRDYHRFHGVPMPWIVPRLSATFVPHKAQEMLEKCRLEPWDKIPAEWGQVMPSIDKGIAVLRQEWLQSCLSLFKEELSLEAMQTAVHFSVAKLHRKVVRSRLRKQKIPPYALHYLSNLLHPQGKPQERVLNWWEFQSATSENLVQECLRKLDWAFHGHYYCFL